MVKVNNSKTSVFRYMLIVFCFMLFALCTLLFALSSEAKVAGNCSNCHTMHNSQGGQPMARGDAPWGGTGGSTDARPSLLIASCLGCHSLMIADESTKVIGGSIIPIVFNTSEPTYGLAAGNFFYVSTTNDNTGHNIFPTNTDGTLNNTPPGGNFPSGGTYTGQLRCSGTRGCHGHNGGQSGDAAVDNETQAMKGAHHGDDSVIDGSTVAKSYRFLLGITGKEDSDWEQETSTAHNEYKGDANFSAHDTISYFCGECHGNFHSTAGVGDASPWLRHPTDIFLPLTGEYATYNPTTTYNNLVPVGYTDFNNPSRATAVIMCLSCHRAHASRDFKMMRWNYKDWPGSGTNGCNLCHTSKN